MKFDAIIETIGSFGRYQKVVYLMVCMMAIPVGFHQLAQVFLAGESDHWCEVEAWEGEDCSRWDMSPEQCREAKRNASTPINATEENGLGKCFKYAMADELQFHPDLNPNNYNNTAVIPCNDGWIYDRSQFRSTIISKFDLVCSLGDMDSLAQSLFFAGVLIGSVLYGALSDIYGRRPTLLMALLIQATSGLIVAFSPTFWFYTLFRVILATANMGVFLLAFVIGTELVGPSKRPIAGIAIELFFSIGYMLLAGLAYFIRDWWILQISITIPVFFMLILIPFLPESARWLLMKGRTDEAEKIIRKAAEVNRATLPEPLFTEEDIKEQEAAAHAKQATALDLFRTPNLRKRTLNCMFNWFVNTLVYYGLSLSTSDLGVNVYIAFFISGAVEFPAYISCIFAIEKFGRKWSTFGYMVAGGVACLCTIFTPLGVPRTVVAMIGKFGISGSFAIIYIYSAELFPTPVRSVGVGMCSMSARVAGILAPQILNLTSIWESLPVLIFGVMCLIAGALILLLPETCGQQLPETLEEGEMFGTNVQEYTIKSPPRFTPKDAGENGTVNRAFDGAVELDEVKKS